MPQGRKIRRLAEKSRSLAGKTSERLEISTKGLVFGNKTPIFSVPKIRKKGSLRLASHIAWQRYKEMGRNANRSLRSRAGGKSLRQGGRGVIEHFLQPPVFALLPIAEERRRQLSCVRAPIKSVEEAPKVLFLFYLCRLEIDKKIFTYGK